MFNLPPVTSRLTGAVLGLGLIASPALAGEFVFVPEKATEGLQSQSGRFDTMLVSPDADLRNYSGVEIRSVVVKPRDRALARRMTGPDRKELARAFRRDFARGLGDRLAENGGAGTLVLSAAITYAWPNTDIGGRYMTTRGGSFGRSTSTGAGGAAFEGILKDARTGKVVAVLADEYSGRPLTSNNNLTSRWGDAREGFRRWGKYLGRELGGASGS